MPRETHHRSRYIWFGIIVAVIVILAVIWFITDNGAVTAQPPAPENAVTQAP